MKTFQLDRLTLRLFLVLLVFHMHHVLEEAGGRFFAMGRYPNPGAFLAANGILLALPVIFLYFLLEGRRWAQTLGLLYGAVMAADGLGHIVATILTGRYDGRFAGAISGLGLAGVGIPFAVRLWQARKEDATGNAAEAAVS
jgi:hypothetical protein